MAKELGPKGIRVNMIAPGFILTDMTKESSLSLEQSMTQMKSETPMGRLATPEDISKLVLFLAKSDNLITGQCITVDGGYTL